MKPGETPTRPVMDVRGPATRPTAPVVARTAPTPPQTPAAPHVAAQPAAAQPVAVQQDGGIPVRQSPMALRQPPTDADESEETSDTTAQEDTTETAPSQPEAPKAKKASNLVVIPVTLTIVAMIFISSVAIYMYLQS